MRLLLRGTGLEVRPGEPLLMGIVNAGPDSFSDPGSRSVRQLLGLAREKAAAGAALIDLGGESGRTDRGAVSEDEEAGRVVPVIRALAAEGFLVSVDTWRAPVARAALDAGAVMVNDVSALSDPSVADACAEAGAALVVTHTRLPPKRKGFPKYADPVEEVRELLSQRTAEAVRRGVGEESLLLDPGLDLAKTPAQSLELLRRLRELHSLGHPLLVAASRKDFIGALTGRLPAERGAGTLAALGAAADGGAAVLRVHDVEAAADYLRVRAAIRDGEAEDLRLVEHLRREKDHAA